MEGGSQAQDHGQAIYAKIWYSVSSTFATGCSVLVTNEPILSFVILFLVLCFCFQFCDSVLGFVILF